MMRVSCTVLTCAVVAALSPGARKSRYRGQAKALLQAAWTAALVNLNPIGARLAPQAG